MTDTDASPVAREALTKASEANQAAQLATAGLARHEEVCAERMAVLRNDIQKLFDNGSALSRRINSLIIAVGAQLILILLGVVGFLAGWVIKLLMENAA